MQIIFNVKISDQRYMYMLHHVTLANTVYMFLFQGITLKLLNNKLIIARILYGGLIHRQGMYRKVFLPIIRNEKLKFSFY